MIFDTYHSRLCQELIETLWNVNVIIMDEKTSHDTQINRNIVECKSAYQTEQTLVTRELIETLWNVNLFMRFSRWTTYDELIETLWNVN